MLLTVIFPIHTAFAFFRIEGIASQLLSALPVKNAILSRFAHSAIAEEKQYVAFAMQYIYTVL